MNDYEIIILQLFALILLLPHAINNNTNNSKTNGYDPNVLNKTYTTIQEAEIMTSLKYQSIAKGVPELSEDTLEIWKYSLSLNTHNVDDELGEIIFNNPYTFEISDDVKEHDKTEAMKEYDELKVKFDGRKDARKLLFHAHTEIVKTIGNDDRLTITTIDAPNPAGLYSFLVTNYQVNTMHTRQILLQDIVNMQMEVDEKFTTFVQRINTAVKDYNKMQNKELQIGDSIKLQALLLGVKAHHHETFNVTLQYLRRDKNLTFRQAVNEMKPVAVEHHLEEEKANKAKANQAKQANEKKADCYSWGGYGECPRGDNCPYNHGVPGTKRCSNCNGKHNTKRCPSNSNKKANKAMSAMKQSYEQKMTNLKEKHESEVKELQNQAKPKPSYFAGSDDDEEDANYFSDDQTTHQQKAKANAAYADSTANTSNHTDEKSTREQVEEFKMVLFFIAFLTALVNAFKWAGNNINTTSRHFRQMLSIALIIVGTAVFVSGSEISQTLVSPVNGLHIHSAGNGSISTLGSVFLAAGSPHSRFKTTWSVDSACTAHITNNISVINKKTIKNMITNIETANGQIMKSPLMGNADVRVRDSNGTVFKLGLKNVLYVPQASSNLISVGELLKNSHRLIFDNNVCQILNKKSKSNAVIRMKKNMFDIVQNNTSSSSKTKPNSDNDFANVADSQGNINDSRLWHNRLCHYSDPYIRKATNSNDINNEGHCEACIQGDIKRRPWKKVTNSDDIKTTERLDKVMADTCQPFSDCLSTHKNKYFFLFVDVHTRKKWIRFGRYKSDLKAQFKIWRDQVENETGRRPVVFMPDGGGEFDNLQLENYLREDGTLFEVTNADCPNQNPYVERANGTVQAHIKKLLSHSGLPNKYWEDAARFSVQVQNAMPVKTNEWKTPNSQWNSHTDKTLERVRTFGCTVWYTNPKTKRRKGEPKARKGIYLGTGEKHSHGWKILDLETRRIVYTRDAYFFEDQFPFKEPAITRSPQKVSEENESAIYLDPGPAGDAVDDYALPEDAPAELPDRPNIEDDRDDSAEQGGDHIEDNAIVPPEHREHRRSSRARPPVDYSVGMNQKTRLRNVDGESVNVGYTGVNAQPVHAEEIELEMENESEVEQVNPDEIAAAAVSPGLDQDFKSMTRKQIMQTPFKEEFLAAERRELEALQKHRTYKEVKRPSKQAPITCRWCYDVKRDVNNNIILFKARLVAKGFQQVEGVDYNETYAATAQMKSFRVTMALSQLLNLRVTQIDISNAFLHGTLDEEIYMTHPPGYKPEGTTKVLRLHKSLYGLKQAGRVWNQCFVSALTEIGFTPLVSDTQVLQYRKGKSFCIIGLHVDDATIACNDEALRRKILMMLEQKFLVKDLGTVSHYLGMRVTKQGGSTKIDQEPYVEKLVAKFKMEQAEAADTPGVAGMVLSKDDCPAPQSEEQEKMRETPFRQLVGSVMYAYIGTRPDVGSVLTKVASFCNNPAQLHWKAAKRILKFLKGTKNSFIQYSGRLYKNDKVKITVYCDSDWGQCKDNRKSTSGYVIMIAGGPVVWSCKKQRTVALSATEAEFVSLCEATKDTLWLTYFLTELGISYETPTIYTDSQSAIQWSKNAKHHQRNKHVAIKYFFVRDEVARETIKIAYISTKNNVADVLTKSTTKSIFQFLRPKLMGRAWRTVKRFGQGGASE